MPGMISKMSRVEISNRFYNALAGTLVKICDVVDYRYREYYNMYPRRARTAVLSKLGGVSKGVHALNNSMCPRGHHTVRLVQGVLCKMSKGYTHS